MAPFPEEVDVFTGPHSRMKQLVEVSALKVHLTDFSKDEDVLTLLHSLHRTFCEFKTHEQIENTLIMKKLKKKLKTLSIHDAAVCNCHNDSQLTDMLSLVKDGYSCTRKSLIERINYGFKLERALDDFNKEFLPHMKEEEEVFQPMLMKYFAYDELKSLKDSVLREHTKWRSIVLSHEKTDNEPEDTQKQTEINYFDLLPPEVLIHVFAFLNPQDLIRCSSVCHRWNIEAFNKSLWSNISPVYWAKGYWSLHEQSSCETASAFLQPNNLSLSDEDADIDETEGYEEWKFYNSQGNTIPGCRHLEVRKERNLLNGLIQHVLPKIGYGVHKLNLANCGSLTNSQFRSMVQLCPNIAWLDVSDTDINDFAFKGLSFFRVFEKLKYFDLSACHVSDEGLKLFAECFCKGLTQNLLLSDVKMNCKKHNQSNEQRYKCKSCPVQDDLELSNMEHLSLSGCYRITDVGLRYLENVGMFRKLHFFDVSGCWQLTGPKLREVIERSPYLSAENLFYCSEIIDGPYEHEANGCQNIGQNFRSCCRKDI